MTEVADKYISKGGRVKPYGRDNYIMDLIILSNFLVWAEDDGAMYGMEHASDAFKSMCRLLDIDGVTLKKIARGEK